MPDSQESKEMGCVTCDAGFRESLPRLQSGKEMGVHKNF